jgi:predicted nucleic acid-binding protein
MIVLDTNVVAELMRPKPSPAVVRWIGARPAVSLYTTAISQADILRSIAILPRSKRRDALAAAADAMFDNEFRGRTLGFGSDAARCYAAIAAERRRLGRPLTVFDARIAAIARAYAAPVATKNPEAFADCGVSVINPWS